MPQPFLLALPVLHLDDFNLTVDLNGQILGQVVGHFGVLLPLDVVHEGHVGCLRWELKCEVVVPLVERNVELSQDRLETVVEPVFDFYLKLAVDLLVLIEISALKRVKSIVHELFFELRDAVKLPSFVL